MNRQSPIAQALLGLRSPITQNIFLVYKPPQPGSSAQPYIGMCDQAFAKGRSPEQSRIDRLAGEDIRGQAARLLHQQDNLKQWSVQTYFTDSSGKQVTRYAIHQTTEEGSGGGAQPQMDVQATLTMLYEQALERGVDVTAIAASPSLALQVAMLKKALKPAPTQGEGTIGTPDPLADPSGDTDIPF